MRFKKIREYLFLGLSNFSSSIILGIFWLYLATILDKTDYGELGFLMSIANVGNAIALLGLRNTIVVYESKHENIFSSAFVVGLLTSTIVAGIVFVMIQNIVLSGLIIGLSIFGLVLGGLNGKRRYNDYSKYLLLRASIAVILAIILYQLFGINGILLGYFTASLLVLKELASLFNKKLEFGLLRKKIKFLFYNWAVRLSQVFFHWGDKVLVGLLFGFSILGSFTFATQYMLLLDAFPRSLAQYLLPQEAEGTKNRTMKFLFIGISIFIAILSILLLPLAIDFILPQYRDVVFPLQIMSVAIIPLSISMIQQTEFLGQENSRVVLIGNIIQSGLYFVLIIVIGHHLGLVGLALGFIFAAVARSGFNLLIRLKLSSST